MVLKVGVQHVWMLTGVKVVQIIKLIERVSLMKANQRKERVEMKKELKENTIILIENAIIIMQVAFGERIRKGKKKLSATDLVK